uniref:Uncharacterized protein n=1 Tax=Anopheles merus TaxID=30066 RepID=A0A2C9H5M7_ANOME
MKQSFQLAVLLLIVALCFTYAANTYNDEVSEPPCDFTGCKSKVVKRAPSSVMCIVVNRTMVCPWGFVGMG